MSGKDRGAVSMAGHAGKAFWYSTNTGDFVTSTYYYDIYIIQEPYWFLFDKGPIAAMHGSPWRYDTHVPMIFLGSAIQPKMVHRRVHPVDVAPTIAAILGMTPPGSAEGSALEEVLR